MRCLRDFFAIKQYIFPIDIDIFRVLLYSYFIELMEVIMKRGNSRLLSIFYIKDLFNLSISKEYDLTYHEIVALCYIKEKGTVSQSMLVKRLRMDKSSVTKLINKMVKNELVKRDFDPLDLRYRVLMPTDKLMQLHLPKYSFTDAFIEYIIQDATKEEMHGFYQTITKMYDRAKNEQRNDFVNLLEFMNEKSSSVGDIISTD